MAWEKLDDEIIAYLSNDLTASEKEAFELRLQTDTALAEAMERHRTFEDQLRNHGIYADKADEINKLNQEFSQKQANQKSQNRTYLFLAATVVVILLSFFFVTQSNSGYCPEELYAEAFSPRRSPEYAGQAQDAVRKLHLGHSFFNQKAIEKATEYYQQALAIGRLSQAQQEEAHFFLGQSKMFQRDFNAALNSFDRITQSAYLQLSQWYMALSHLALGEVEKARPLLTEISLEPTHDRQSEALALLEKWNQLKVCK